LPDWKRIIIGDAFVLSSRDPNFYRDLFLTQPFLYFSIAAVTSLVFRANDYRAGIKCAALALLAILLARERFVLLAASLGFVSVQGGISFVLKHDVIGLALSIVAGASFLLLVRFLFLSDYKPSYPIPSSGTIVDLVVGLVSLASTVAIFHYWIGP